MMTSVSRALGERAALAQGVEHRAQLSPREDLGLVYLPAAVTEHAKSPMANVCTRAGPVPVHQHTVTSPGGPQEAKSVHISDKL